MMRAFDRGMCLNLVCALSVCVLAGHALAKEAVITTYEGRTLTGELVAQDEVSVTLLISGIKTPIPKRTIQNLEIKDEPAEQYRKMRAELQDDDLDGRYRLAYTMYEKKWFDLAMVELQSLEQSFPDSDKVRALQAVVKSRLERQQETAPPAARPVTPANNNAAVTEVTETPGPDTRLTEQDINVIRVYEADLNAQPNVTLPPDTIDKLFKDYASDDRLVKDQRAFRKLQGYEQLEVLFTLQARELYPDVIIRQDSPAMKDFRSQVHQRYVLNYCATTGCHGDNSPGGLFLFRIQPNSDATVYTNFYILNRMKGAGGSMIDRDEPRRSLLLQYGLERDAAATPHPDVPGWRAQFNNEEDARFVQYAEAIDKLWKPAPDYGISYSPPVWKQEEPADAPAPQTNP
jgi:hypothetical protein